MAGNVRGFMQVGMQRYVCPLPLLIDNMLIKLSTKVNSYSSAGAETWICK